MKKYYKAIKSLILVITVALLASCSDFLTVIPKNIVTEDNFWNEKTDIEQMVAGVYVKLQSSDIIQRCLVWGELRSDNTDMGRNIENNDDLYRLMKENLRPDNTYTDYAKFYEVINCANVVIERAPEVGEKDPTFTQSQVAATIAEMKAIRALCFFYIVRAFKDCPYPTHAYQSEDVLDPQPAVSGDSIILDQIAELEGCVSQALRKYPKHNNRDFNNNYNRITQNGIYAILCDMCLWMGQYDKVVKYAENIIVSKHKDYENDYSRRVDEASGGSPVLFRAEDDYYNHAGYYGYPLYPCYRSKTYGADYQAIFDEGNSFESIFELGYQKSSSSTGQNLKIGGISTFYGSQASSETVNDGPIYANMDIVLDVHNGVFRYYDSRYDARAYYNTQPDGEWSKGFPAKYVSGQTEVESVTTTELFKASYRGSSRSSFNWIFYRLTDIMLMEAEALVELGGNDLNTIDPETNEVIVDENLDKAFKICYAVNRRSLLTDDYKSGSEKAGAAKVVLNQSKYTTKYTMRELVMNERHREFMFEGKRWFDLLRRCRREGSTSYVRGKVHAKGTASSATLFLNMESLYWPYNKTELKANPDLHQKSFYAGMDDDDDDDFQVGVIKK